MFDSLNEETKSGDGDGDDDGYSFITELAKPSYLLKKEQSSNEAELGMRRRKMPFKRRTRGLEEADPGVIDEEQDQSTT